MTIFISLQVLQHKAINIEQFSSSRWSLKLVFLQLIVLRGHLPEAWLPSISSSSYIPLRTSLLTDATRTPNIIIIVTNQCIRRTGVKGCAVNILETCHWLLLVSLCCLTLVSPVANQELHTRVLLPRASIMFILTAFIFWADSTARGFQAACFAKIFTIIAIKFFSKRRKL